MKDSIPESEAISTVRTHLSVEQNERCPEDMVLRYLRATGNDTRHTIKRIQDTLAWWAIEDPTRMYCSACRDKCPHSHYMQVVGRDLIGRPLIYSCMELATNKDIEDNRRHMINIFESAISLMKPGSNVESWGWILDFHGFSIRDCDPRLARVFLHLAATHYPERLGYFYIIDAPLIFSSLWNAIKSFIDPKTRNKITFLSLQKKVKVQEAFKENFDEETMQWLLNEMEENRKGGEFGQRKKVYDHAALEKLGGSMGGDKMAAAVVVVGDGNLDGDRKKEKSKHCHLGTPAFLRELSTWKGPIPPQLIFNKYQPDTTE
ncbi:putative CRAL-TRIO domain-containing protein C23B6.04c [Nannochloris sp. 'desiccata']|nr:putative CRAL-TRIO domain-containing protein C23B6.04c [Chlorella desiccata (nom. nud.)]